MAYDYERRRVALLQSPEFFEEELGGVIDTVKNVQRYGKVMGQALALLRPVAECLKSKPLAKLSCPEGFLDMDVGGLAEFIYDRAKE